jgi:hypothetical protein
MQGEERREEEKRRSEVMTSDAEERRALRTGRDTVPAAITPHLPGPRDLITTTTPWSSSSKVALTGWFRYLVRNLALGVVSFCFVN